MQSSALKGRLAFTLSGLSACFHLCEWFVVTLTGISVGCYTGSHETRKVRVNWEKWCNYLRVSSLWSHEYKSNESCLWTNQRKLIKCRHTINVMPYFSEDLWTHIMTSWGFSCNWKDDTPSQQPYFCSPALTHALSPQSTLSSNIL